MDPLPPETTTPMPPTLHEVFNRELGWPGRLIDRPPYVVHGDFDEHGHQIPGSCACEICLPRAKPHITPRRWPAFTAKMSDRSPTVTP